MKVPKTVFHTLLGLMIIGGFLVAQAPTGKIIGMVTDVDGFPLPGVSIEATSAKLIGKATAVTDESGIYRLFALPPGTYKITYTLPGFKPFIRQDIVVSLEATIKVDISMEMGAIEEEITVIGQSPLIDVKSTVKGMTLTKEMFELLPRGRNFDTLVTAVPGVSNEPWLGGLSVDGASGAENMFYMDGTDITNMVTGVRGQSAAFEFVDEIQIKASGYQAEFGGSLGGVVNVITRQGGNEFHGELIGYYSGSALEGKERDTLRLDLYDTTKSEYVNYQDLYGKDKTHRFEGGFSLGGYIFKDRLWFFGSVLPVYRPVERHIKFEPSKIEDDSTQKNYEYNFQAKLTAQPFSFLRLGASFVNNFSKYKGDLPPRDGTGSPTTDYEAYGFSYPNWSAAGTADITLGNNFMINVRGGMFSSDQTNQLVAPTEPCYQFLQEAPGGYPRTNNLMFPDIPAQYVKPTGYVNYPRGQALVINKRLRQKAYAGSDFSYFMNLAGEHALKFGVQWVYQLDDVARQANYPVVFLGWDRTFVLGGIVQGPGRGKYGFYGVRGNDKTGPYGEVYSPHSNRWSLYIQDSWTITDKFTLNFGVRTESEFIPSYSDDPEFADVKPIEFKFKDKLAPRVGFIYDVFGDASLKVFGSYGLYFDVFKLYMASNAYGGMKWKSAYYTLDTYEWDKIGKDNYYPGTFIGVVDWRHPSFESTDPDLKPMSQQEISFGAEKMLMQNLSATVRVVQKHLRYAIEDVGVMVPGVGEEYYTTNPGYGYSRSAPEGKFDPKYPECPKAKREYWAVNFSLDKRLGDNWLGGISYTWSRLTGNYSGLASSDEFGRVSPNVERYFDLWHLAYDKNLDPIDGPQNTDRTHFFKFYGAYTFPFRLTVGAVVNAMSGTPVSEEWDVMAEGYLPYNRGNLGRTPFLWFANAYAEYNMRLGKTMLNFNVNVDNVFNVKTARRIFSSRTQAELHVTEAQLLSKNWDLETAGLVPDPRYKKELDFYAPISVRFGVRFMF